MNAASSLLSTSAACEYLHISQLMIISWLCATSAFFFLARQDSSVHLEQIKPSEKQSTELSHETGHGVRPHPPDPSRAPPGSAGQTSIRSHSHCQAVYGDARAWQHANRGPNEPPPPLDEDETAGTRDWAWSWRGWKWRLFSFHPFSSRPCLIPGVIWKLEWFPERTRWFLSGLALINSVSHPNPPVRYYWLRQHFCLTPNPPFSSNFFSSTVNVAQSSEVKRSPWMKNSAFSSGCWNYF